ncbi:MAG TPA: UvrD-helicase domain-containing protein, partial [Gammaproteobacteria bacterium]|nr:UvrD-helicase domain-containing protein [Gammaproteobacteria bacterium]
WLNNPDLLTHYRNRFSHVLVDEFQDTNTIQYAWLRLLSGEQGNIFIVGDDDQAVYGWRNAKIENIINFDKDFENTKTFRLEQNYRSTGNILNAANALIENNPGRLGKELWTEDHEGEPIQLYAAFNDLDEARFIAEQIQFWVDKGGKRDENAILYRSNAQSRVLEEALLSANIPYRIYGGLRFFERAEIKDALAYLRLMAHRHDDSAFERIVNTPTRGIGDRTVEVVRSHARGAGISLWQAATEQSEGTLLAARARNALINFMQLIERMSEEATDKVLSDQVDIAIHKSTLFDHYKNQKSEKAQARVENLEELVTAARQYSPEDGSLNILDEFLAQAALEAGDTQGDEWEDCVQLMTLHSAKGLEFPQVFLSGMEEGLFPHSRSAEDPDSLEEERRLCYVGITRARQKLTMTHAESRRLYGKESYPRVSRFIKEIPNELLQEVRIRSTISRPVSSYSSSYTQNSRSRIVEDSGTGLHPGQQVRHTKFGEGTVLMLEGSGPQARIQIHFPEAGTKWLVASYAKLEPA